MEDVVTVLDRERRALERLLFRLHHARTVLAADDDRFLALAADELETAAHAVRELEAARAAIVAAIDGATLRDLAAGSPEPYASMLRAHRNELGRLTGEVGAFLETTQLLATDRLAELRGDRRRRTDRRVRPARTRTDELDRAVAAAGYESLLAASDSLRLPALVSFLG